jgi:hypothetical protein
MPLFELPLNCRPPLPWRSLVQSPLAEGVEVDFYDFGGSTLLRFSGDFGDDYELCADESLHAKLW